MSPSKFAVNPAKPSLLIRRLRLPPLASLCSMRKRVSSLISRLRCEALIRPLRPLQGRTARVMGTCGRLGGDRRLISVTPSASATEGEDGADRARRYTQKPRTERKSREIEKQARRAQNSWTGRAHLLHVTTTPFFMIFMTPIFMPTCEPE
jgi:hypothetical protein